MAEPPRPDTDNPVIEPPANGGHDERSDHSLELRIRQQEILAELGVAALQRIGFAELLNRTVQLAAKGLEAELCKILEYLPEENALILRAGVGWDPNLIGVARVGADLGSPSGFALRTGKPVISNHLEFEERFKTPDLLKAHGVHRAINVILQGDGAPFGVLEVDSRSEGEFSEHDIAFLQGAANIVGMAIERQRYERSLHDALEHQKVLLKEINHRIKNSLQLVASMLNLQTTATSDPGLTQSLQQAVGRVTAIVRIHERLYLTADISNVDLSAYLGDICRDLAGLLPNSEIHYEPAEVIPVETDCAVRVALLATELVTNAAKHASPKDSRGVIQVRLTRTRADVVRLSVRDNGRGLPESFEAASGLGMRIVKALVQQTGSTLTLKRHQPGVEFVIEMPLQSELPAQST